MQPGRLPVARSDYDAFVREALDAVARRARLFDALVPLVWAIIGSAVYVVAAVVIEHWLDQDLSLGVRRALACGVAAVAVLCAATRVTPSLTRRMNDRYLARMIEKRYPELGNTVVTTVESLSRPDVDPGVVLGLVERSAEQLARRDLRVCVPAGRLTRALRVGCGIVVVLLIYTLFAPKAVWPSLQRAFGMDVPAPTRTQIEWQSPEDGASVTRGTAIAFSAKLNGQTPRGANVECSIDDGATWPAGRRLLLMPDEPLAGRAAIWSARMPGADVQATMLCRIVAGDAISPARRIEVRPAPAIESAETTYYPPAYMNLPVETRAGADIDAWEGSRIELRLRSNVPVANGVVQFEDARNATARRMEVAGDDAKQLRAEWIVEDDAEFRIALRDRWGAANVPIAQRQRVKRDEPPRIGLNAPAGDLELAAADSFEIDARVTDDFGVTDVALIYRRARIEGRLSLNEGAALGGRGVHVAGSVSLAAMNAAPGDVIEWYIEARDNRRNLRDKPDPRIGVGPTRIIRVRAAASEGAARDAKSAASRAARRSASKNGKAFEPNPPADQKPPSNQRGQPDASGDASGSAGDQPSGDGAEGRPAGAGAAVEGQEGQPESAGGEAGAAHPNEPTDAEMSGGEGERNSGQGAASRDTDESGNGESQGGAEPQSGQRDAAGDAGADDSGPGDGATEGETGESREELAQRHREALRRLIEEMDGNGQRDSDRDNGEHTDADSGGRPNDESSRNKAKPTQAGPDESDETRPPPSTGDAEEQSTNGLGADSEADADSGHEPSATQPADTTQGGDQPTGEAGETGESDGASGAKTGAQTTSRPAEAGASQPAGAGSEGGPQPEGKNESDKGAESARDSSGDTQGGEASGSEGESRPGERGPSGQGEPARDADSSNDAGGPGQGGKNRAGPDSDNEPPAPEPLENDGAFEGGGDGGDLGIDMGRAERAVNELDRRLRTGEVDDSLLKELGWTKARAAEFVKRFRRAAHPPGARNGDPSGGPTTGGTATVRTPGDTQVRRGGAVGVELRGARGDITSDRTRPTLRELPPENVPAEYRDLLEAYYREMAREQREP